MSSMNNSICDMDDEVREELRRFRFEKHDGNAALILKIDRQQKMIKLDERMQPVDPDQLRDNLPDHQPRYIIYSYKMVHSDGRISFPMCFIFYTPRDSQMELQMMYAGSKLALQREADLTRFYEIRELDELTEEWLREKLSK